MIYIVLIIAWVYKPQHISTLRVPMDLEPLLLTLSIDKN